MEKYYARISNERYIESIYFRAVLDLILKIGAGNFLISFNTIVKRFEKISKIRLK
jgi:hypothetical protein